MLRTALLTSLAMLGFAANSLLNRSALVEDAIDPGSFAALRLASGAVALVLLVRTRRGRPAGSWTGATALFLYAVPFSLSYLSLTAATGALILFGAVQATMIGVGLWEGERPGSLEWAGFVAAVGGLVYLVSPGLQAPPLAGSLLMVTAGISWGIYSLLGRGGEGPLAVTAGNFVRATPMALAVAVVAALASGGPQLTSRGALLAVFSGAVTSGLAYAVWYAALRDLEATRAAMVQLSVPVLAAFGGVLLLEEEITSRLVVASVLVLGGVAIALRRRRALPIGVPGRG